MAKKLTPEMRDIYARVAMLYNGGMRRDAIIATMQISLDVYRRAYFYLRLYKMISAGRKAKQAQPKPPKPVRAPKRATPLPIEPPKPVAIRPDTSSAVDAYLARHGSHVCASRYGKCDKPGVHIIPKGDPFAPVPVETQPQMKRGRKRKYFSFGRAA